MSPGVQRPAAPYLVEADLKHVQLAHMLVVLRGGGDADAQIDPFEIVPARAQPLFQLWEHAGAQILALRLHVCKRAGDEYRTRLPHLQRSQCTEAWSTVIGEGVVRIEPDRLVMIGEGPVKVTI